MWFIAPETIGEWLVNLTGVHQSDTWVESTNPSTIEGIDWFDSKFWLAVTRVGQNIAKVLFEVGYYSWNPTNWVMLWVLARQILERNQSGSKSHALHALNWCYSYELRVKLVLWAVNWYCYLPSIFNLHWILQISSICIEIGCKRSQHYIKRSGITENLHQKFGL